jgi:hypothetical protein
MRRFGWGATNRPLLKRPGAGYGRSANGAPGPMQDVQPREEIVPEMFTENTESPVIRTTYATDFRGNTKTQERGETTIDLTFE